MIEERVELVPCDQAAEGLQPADRAFDDPAPAKAAQGPAVLRGRSLSAAAMRAYQLDVAIGQPRAKRVAVGGSVVDQAVGHVGSDRLVEQRLNQSDFRGTCAIDVDRQRQAGAIDEQHELAALAALRGAYAIAPFFGEAIVPSAKPSA